MQAATNFATAMLRARAKRPHRSRSPPLGLAGNTLNRRSDSFQSRITSAAASHESNFFMRDPREPRLHAVFQLLAATLLLKSCEAGLFFAQKIQLAGKDQTDRCAEIAAAARGIYDCVCAASDIPAQIRAVSGYNEKNCPRNGGPIGTQALTERLFPELGDLVREARDLAAGGTFVHYAFLSSAHERGLSSLKRGLRRRRITGSDRFLDVSDGTAHARATRFVDDGPPRNFSGRLLGGFRISHRISRLNTWRIGCLAPSIRRKRERRRNLAATGSPYSQATRGRQRPRKGDRTPSR